MIISPHAQRSPAWIADRLGLPTASGFDKIITPGGKACDGKTRETYLRTLVIEWLFAQPFNPMQTQWMQRGNQLEDEARSWLSVRLEEDIVQCGLVWRDDKRCGASPDGFVGELESDHHAEIKIPNAVEHLGYVLDGLSPAYRVQMQGQMWVCETARCEFVSYNPDLRNFTDGVTRDEPFIAKLADAVNRFCDDLDAAKARCEAMGMKPRKPDTTPAPSMDFLGNRPLSDFIPTEPPMSIDEIDLQFEGSEPLF